MRVLILPALLVFGIGSAVAAPCEILPYQNQCQGSNLWPAPSGWAADNNGDCQPQPPQYVAPSEKRYAYYYPYYGNQALYSSSLSACSAGGGPEQNCQMVTGSWSYWTCGGGWQAPLG
jgi:hypothetical protein